MTWNNVIIRNDNQPLPHCTHFSNKWQTAQVQHITSKTKTLERALFLSFFNHIVCVFLDPIDLPGVWRLVTALKTAHNDCGSSMLHSSATHCFNTNFKREWKVISDLLPRPSQLSLSKTQITQQLGYFKLGFYVIHRSSTIIIHITVRQKWLQ